MPTKLRMRDVLERHPDLDKSTVLWWAKKNCDPIGRKIKSWPDATGLRFRLYDGEDIAKAAKKRGKLAPDHEFADALGTWISVQRARDKYRVNWNSIANWRDGGCPALGGRKLEVRIERFGGGPKGRRDYVRRKDVEAIVAAREEMPAADPNWATTAEAKKLYGFNKRFLLTYTRIPHRFLGRRIKTEFRDRRGSRGGPARIFWHSDLSELRRNLEGVSAPANWVTAAEAVAEFGFALSSPYYWHRRACIYLDGKNLEAQLLPNRKSSSRAKVWHYSRAELAIIAQRKNRHTERAYRDAEGEWLLRRDACARAGINSRELWAWVNGPCPHLDGRPIRHKRVQMGLHGIHYKQPVWVHHVDDMDRINRRINGLPDPITKAGSGAVPTRQAGKRGKPLTNQERDRRRQIIEGGRRAMSAVPYADRSKALKAYCCDQRITVATYHAWVSAESVANARNSVI